MGKFWQKVPFPTDMSLSLHRMLEKTFEIFIGTRKLLTSGPLAAL